MEHAQSKGYPGNGIMGGTGNLFSGSAISEITIPAAVDISEMFSALEGCDYLRKVTIDAKSINPIHSQTAVHWRR